MFGAGELSFHPRHKSEAYNYPIDIIGSCQEKSFSDFLGIISYFVVICYYFYHFRRDGVN
jgi:hypothetical protein